MGGGKTRRRSQIHTPGFFSEKKEIGHYIREEKKEDGQKRQ